MKRYRVVYTQSSLCSAYVEAESEEEAKQIAEDMDGSEFYEEPTSGDWEFFCIMEEGE